MKPILFCLLCGSVLLAGCSSNSVSTREGYSVASQSGSRKNVRRRNDPAVKLDLVRAETLLNDYRRRYKLAPLSFHPQLQETASRHAAELARYSRVSHSGRNGSNPAQRVSASGYKWSAVGENVSAGRISIPEVIKAWHKSRPHRKNLKLRQAVHFGLAVRHNPNSVLSNYWVLVVAAPESADRKSSKSRMKIGFGGRDN